MRAQSPLSSYIRALTFVGMLSILACAPAPLEQIAQPQDPHYVERGRSLVKGLAACGYCHGERASPSALLVGGRAQEDKYGSVFAANLTPASSGLGSWTTIQIIAAIRTHTNSEGKALSRKVHSGFEWLSDNDALAIVAYLQSLSPVEQEVPRRSVSMIERNTTGFFEGKSAVRGYVPEIEKRHVVEYGQYLADHVARCDSCHNSPATIFDSGQYLAGGTTFTIEAEEKVAPGITSSTVDGLGDWEVSQIVHYLQTGQTADGRVVDPRFCPIEFYQNVDESDLKALATYLKTVPSAG